MRRKLALHKIHIGVNLSLVVCILIQEVADMLFHIVVSVELSIEAVALSLSPFYVLYCCTPTRSYIGMLIKWALYSLSLLKDKLSYSFFIL